MVTRAALAALTTALCLAPFSAAAAKKDQAGRPEALIFATAFGFYEGIAGTILLAENDLIGGSSDTIAFGCLLTLATTGGTYALASHVTSKYGVNEAQGSMFNSSLLWGVLNGTGGGLALDVDAEQMLWSTLVTGWTGQAVGILFAANVDRTAGQVGLMNTVGTWAAAETLLVMGIAEVDHSSTYATVGTLAVDLGLLAGAFVSSNGVLGRGVSQERTRLLDLGALAGGLAAPAALFMVYGPEENLPQWYLTAVAIGIPAGIGTAWYLTRDYDQPGDEQARDSAEQSFFLPLASGRF